MRLEALRAEVLNANLELVRQGLVLYTFGNVSGVDRATGVVAIKPSGVDYATMTPADIVLVDLDGRAVEGSLRPSSDLPTHLELYRKFPAIGGVSHSHSEFATAWAQARRAVACMGTTHADYFHGAIPVTRDLSPAEIESDYELATGKAIVEAVAASVGCDKALEMPAALAAGHGPFTWGKDAMDAAHHAAILEYVARINSRALAVNPETIELPSAQREKHYLRKHGPNAYYGQAK